MAIAFRRPPPLPSPAPKFSSANSVSFFSSFSNAFPSVCVRPPLLLLLLAFLLFVSLVANAFFGAQLLFGNGLFQLSDGCATFSFSNFHRQKRQIGERESVLASIEYAIKKIPPKFAEFAVGTEEGDEKPLFVPLYTQLSEKYISKICRQRLGKKFQIGEKNGKKSDDIEKNRTKLRKTTREKVRRRKKYRQKVCPPISLFAAPILMAHRMHRRGAAMRRGNRWFLTEYDTGYSLFQFELKNNGKNVTESAKKRRRFTDKKKRKINDSDAKLDFPTKILTLPEPFRGTDHSVGGAEGDETFFYQLASDDRIQTVHLGTGKRLSRLIYAAKYPLYGASVPPFLPANSVSPQSLRHHSSAFGWSSPLASSVDLEVDQSALWVLFRRPNLSDSSGRPLPHLTVLKLKLDSLKELAQWDLTETKADKLINAFVTCGQMFGVVRAEWKEDSDSFPLQIVPLFDFQNGQSLPRTALPILAPGWNASGHNSISNVQYDAVSDSVTVFDDGKIYTIKIQRRRADQNGK